MGLLDDAKNLADQAVDAAGADTLTSGIETAGDKVDEATGGAAASVVDQVQSAAERQVDGLAGS